MSFTIETEQSNNISFVDVNSFVSNVNLQQIFTEDQILMVQTLISIAFYLILTKLG